MEHRCSYMHSLVCIYLYEVDRLTWGFWHRRRGYWWHSFPHWEGIRFLDVNYDSIGCQECLGHRCCMLQTTSNHLLSIHWLKLMKILTSWIYVINCKVNGPKKETKSGSSNRTKKWNCRNKSSAKVGTPTVEIH